MDTGTGNFTRVSPEVALKIEANIVDSGVFKVGEELIIKGSKFRIQSIGRTKMKLKLLKSK